MKKVFLYAHGGSGNHGCEAIVRSTEKVLHDVLNDQIVVFSRKMNEDKKYGIDSFCKIMSDRKQTSKFSFSFLKAYAALKLKHDYVPLDKLPYKKQFKMVHKGDLAFSIGGDNYCYANFNSYIMMHDLMLAQGARTVLWGCSVEPKLLENPNVASDIKRYSLITAREIISFQALKKVNPNTILVADPAFVLPTVATELPNGFQEYNMVGINVSPMVVENETIKGITMRNYEELIKYILRETTMGIALIPHVVWKDGDDRTTLETLYKKFVNTGRVVLIGDQTCGKLKYIISKCSFFVGARTHATIAAYSSCVPTLVVGYSVKARGIARDLFGNEENYTLPVQHLKTKVDLCEKFKWIMQNEAEIKKKLQTVIPVFEERAKAASVHINKLINEK